jgi:hypothetical protein
MAYRDYLTKEDIELLDEYNKDGLYDPEYVEFVQDGPRWFISKTHCMKCGKVIVDFRCPKDQIAISENKHPDNYKPVKRKLAIGAHINILLCPDCETTSIDEGRVLAQIRAGLARESEFAGRHPTHIQDRANWYSENLKFHKEDEK